MKFKANWKFKNLESLEKVREGDPYYDSHLVKAVNKLRTVPLNEYQIEDLRIMIQQNIGLQFLLPISIEQLKKNLFVEGDFYEGDLLQAVLNIEHNFWKKNPERWEEVNTLISGRADELEDEGITFDYFRNFYANR
ncbi:MAG: contact-dependent growth inhibition system immunity protein [Marinoscillum sp.]